MALACRVRLTLCRFERKVSAVIYRIQPRAI
jgi:hypothetical protein